MIEIDRAAPPRLLTIAGSDSGGGAGIQADLKTFAAHGAYGLSVITAVTAQNTREVRAVMDVPTTVVEAQIDAVLEDIGADAVKIGMLAHAAMVSTVAEGLRRHRPSHVVLDPVMVAKSGDVLLRHDAVDALIEELFPLATVITPNLPEAERLTGLPARTGDDLLAIGRHLHSLGPSVLLKGGHGHGDTVVDLLFDGDAVYRYEHPRQHTTSTHGTGCTLSSAVAARLGHGDALPVAVERAIDYLQGAIAAAFPLGGGHGPVNHLHRL